MRAGVSWTRNYQCHKTRFSTIATQSKGHTLGFYLKPKMLYFGLMSFKGQGQIQIIQYDILVLNVVLSK
jgi:hypothetical protein